MTLEDKMNKLRKEADDEPFDMFDPNFGDEAHNRAIDQCVALVEAKKTVIKDWENKLEDLAAINYNLYLAGTVRRADTGADWTHEQALSEIKDFINTLLAAKDSENEKLVREALNTILESGLLDESTKLMCEVVGDYHDGDVYTDRDMDEYRNQAVKAIREFITKIK